MKVRDSQISITKDPYKMINAVIRLLKLHSYMMSEKEKNIWLVQLCKKLASVNNWSEYRFYLKKISMKRNPLLSVILFIALIFRENKILKLHSRVKSFSEKALIKLFRRNPLYYYSS